MAVPKLDYLGETVLSLRVRGHQEGKINRLGFPF
jgi:hypothetical protein